MKNTITSVFLRMAMMLLVTVLASQTVQAGNIVNTSAVITDYFDYADESGMPIGSVAYNAGHDGKPNSIEEVTNYDLWVAGEQVTSANAADLSVIEGVTGSAKYDADKNTLTLSGVTITGGYGTESCGGAIVYNGDKDFRLDVSGTNIVTGDTRSDQSAGILLANPEEFYSINSKDHKVEISIAEGATLTIYAGAAEDDFYPSSYGIVDQSTGEMAITNAGTLNVNGGKGIYCYGIYASSNLTFNGTGTLNATATGGSVYNAAIWAYGIVVNNGNITAEGGNAEYSYGISAEGGEFAGLGNININGGSVVATGWTTALDKAPVLASGMAAKGSASTDGEDAEKYVADNNANYKWFTSSQYQGTTYGMALTPEFMKQMTIYAGCPNYLTLQVENTGEAAGSNVHVGVYSDGELVWEETIDNLPAGETKTWEVADLTIRPVIENTVIGNDNEKVVYKVVCYDMRTRAIKNVFSVYKFPFPHQALKGLYAVCGPSM